MTNPNILLHKITQRSKNMKLNKKSCIIYNDAAKKQSDTLT